MKREPPLGMNCTVLEDGTVIPFPHARGALSESGLYRGNCRMMVIKGGTRTEGDLVVAAPAARQEEEGGAALFNSRTITFYWMNEIWLNGERGVGTHHYSGSFQPVATGHTYVAGNYSGTILLASGYFSAPDPALLASDMGLGWPLSSYQDPPYYPIDGFWVEGFDPPAPTDPGVVPWNINLSVGAELSLTYNDGVDDWYYYFLPITIKEFKLLAQTWPENYGYP